MDRGAHLGLPRLCVLLAALLAIFPCCSQGHWMWLGIASIGVPEKLGCAGLPLSPRQKELCKKKPYLLPSIREGARLGLHECKRQFRHERWNCSVADNPSDASALEGALFPSLGYEMTSGGKQCSPLINPFLYSSALLRSPEGVYSSYFQEEIVNSFSRLERFGSRTKETAFIYAVTAAGLVHSVTRTCSAGNMTECSCDASLQNSGSASEGWHWGGCSDDIQYGMLFSRRFADSPTTNSTEKETDSLALMNLHNSEAGRQAVVAMMSVDCRCHGVSGSCAVKTCWKTMSPFEKIGSFLKDKYENSIQISERIKKKVRRKEKEQRKVPIHKGDLVFINRSPNYCVEDRKLGVPGTHGRECNRTSEGPEGCSLLCCGRGYNTHVVRHVERCECKFVWCCYVRCRRCESMTDVHTCK